MGFVVGRRVLAGVWVALAACTLAVGCAGGGSSGSSNGAGGAAQSGGTSVPSAFAKYWADSSAWCGHAVECGQPLAECQSSWPTAQVTQQGLNISGWTQTDISACDHSSSALDRCYLALACTEVQNYPIQCETQNANFMRDCRALTDAITTVLSGGGNAPTEFARYYADSSSQCTQDDACGIRPLIECQASWPSPPLVQRAVDFIAWTPAEIATCEQATHAIDQCWGAVACADRQNYPQGCEQQDTDFQSACQALIDALVAPEVINPDISAGSPDTSGSSDVNVGAAFCSQVEMCQGISLSPAERVDCEKTVNQAFGLLPDPAGTVRCLGAASCTTLMNDAQAAVGGCISIDPAATQCTATGLHICDTSGTCRDIDCNAGCSFLSLSSTGCAYDAAYGYDKCQCG